MTLHNRLCTAVNDAINPVNERVNIREMLQDGTYMRLRALAEKEGQTIDAILRMLLDGHLEAERDYKSNRPYNCAKCSIPMAREVDLCENCDRAQRENNHER